MSLRDTRRNAYNMAKGRFRKLNGGYAVDQPNGVTKYYDNDGRSQGSQGVDKSSSAYRMCGGQDDD